MYARSASTSIRKKPILRENEVCFIERNFFSDTLKILIKLNQQLNTFLSAKFFYVSSGASQ